MCFATYGQPLRNALDYSYYRSVDQMDNSRHASSAEEVEKPRTAIKIFIRYSTLACQSRAMSPSASFFTRQIHRRINSTPPRRINTKTARTSPTTVRVIRDRKETDMPMEKVQVGDTIIVKSDEKSRLTAP